MKIAGHRFLVTGGNGFIGSHVVQGLLRQDAERVVIFDQAAAAAGLAGAGRDRRVEVLQGDVLQPGQLARAMAGMHGVFHMAVLPLGPCESDPVRAFEINIQGTFNVIQAAVQAGVGKLVYSSASSVYGDTLEVMDEQHPFNPWTMYGVSKLCGEFLLRPFRAKLPYAIVRYMNVYGPHQGSGLIPIVLGKIRAGEPPVINGDGSASFDFVHVRDVAQCTILAMDSEVTAEAFNVGSGTEATVKEVVATLLELTGSSLQPVYKTDGPVPMSRRVGSSEKAKRLLGFEASISLRRGLEELARGTTG
jgi:UDP-glucose 4-epimerase